MFQFGKGIQTLDTALATIPLQRLGTTQECAFLITYLAIERISSYITGQTYYIGSLENKFFFFSATNINFTAQMEDNH